MPLPPQRLRTGRNGWGGRHRLWNLDLHTGESIYSIIFECFFYIFSQDFFWQRHIKKIWCNTCLFAMSDCMLLTVQNDIKTKYLLSFGPYLYTWHAFITDFLKISKFCILKKKNYVNLREWFNSLRLIKIKINCIFGWKRQNTRAWFNSWNHCFGYKHWINIHKPNE